MNNLSTLYMNLLTSRVDVQAALGEISRLVNSGKSGDVKKALALEPKLNRALAGEQRALASYMIAVRTAAAQDSTNGAAAGTIGHAAFNALSPKQRMTFVQSGGRVVDG